MKKEDVKIGMKVVPHSKTVKYYGKFEHEYYWNKIKDSQKYLYVIREIKELNCFTLDCFDFENGGTGNFYNASDFEEYTEIEVKQTEESLMSQFIEGKVVINLKTEESAVKFLEMCHGFGIYFSVNSSGNSKKTYWDTYKELTCYKCLFLSRSLKYADVKFFEEGKHEIIEFKSFKSTMPIASTTTTTTTQKQKYKLTVEGKTITLKDKVTNEKAMSICHESDEFDFGFGVALAKARLEKDEYLIKKLILSGHKQTPKTAKTLEKLRVKKVSKDELYNGKVKCIGRWGNLVELGRTYNIIGGVFTYDNGVRFTNIQSFKDFTNNMISEFEEVK